MSSRTRIGRGGRRNALTAAREAAGVRRGAQAMFVSVEKIGADVVVDVSAVGADIYSFFGITSVLNRGWMGTNGIQWITMAYISIYLLG